MLTNPQEEVMQQEQWRIPNDEANEDLIRALAAVCRPTASNRIVHIPAMGMEIFVFNSGPMVRQISDSMKRNCPGVIDGNPYGIYLSIQARESAIIIREGDECMVLAVDSAMDAFNEIYEQAKGTRDAITDLALAMEPVLAPLALVAA
jgi:hypothetical protein